MLRANRPFLDANPPTSEEHAEAGAGAPPLAGARWPTSGVSGLRQAREPSGPGRIRRRPTQAGRSLPAGSQELRTDYLPPAKLQPNGVHAPQNHDSVLDETRMLLCWQRIFGRGAPVSRKESVMRRVIRTIQEAFRSAMSSPQIEDHEASKDEIARGVVQRTAMGSVRLYRGEFLTS